MSVVYVDNVPFRHSLSEEELEEAGIRIQHARAEKQELMKLLRASIKAGNAAEEEHARMLLTMSPDALLCAAIEANKKLKPRKRRSLERCLVAPSQIDLTKPLDETVRVYPRKKKSGGVRMICDFGFLHRTAQHAVLAILSEYYKPKPFQYTHVGAKKAIAKVKKLLGKGYTHVARLDIKDFYTSFDPDKLVPELPLPKWAAEHVAVGRHMKVDMDQEKTHGSYPSALPHIMDLLSLARSGIPQGSVCSPIIGMFCMSRLAWKPMPGVVVINYADDFLILALSPERLEAAVGKLIEAVGNLPGGHFKLRLIGDAKASRGFNFLGHRLRLVNGVVNTSPTEANLEGLSTRLDDLDERLGKLVFPTGTINPSKNITKAACQLLAEMLALLEGWLAAFSQCDKLERIQLPYMAEIETWASDLGISMMKVRATIDPSMAYRAPPDQSAS